MKKCENKKVVPSEQSCIFSQTTFRSRDFSTENGCVARMCSTGGAGSGAGSGAGWARPRRGAPGGGRRMARGGGGARDTAGFFSVFFAVFSWQIFFADFFGSFFQFFLADFFAYFFRGGSRVLVQNRHLHERAAQKPNRN